MKKEESLSDKIKRINALDEEFIPTVVNVLTPKDVKEAVQKFVEKLRNCDEFFDVKNYEDVHTTDKFMGIVMLYLKKIFGDKLVGGSG